MEYDFKTAVKILKNANLECKSGNYSIAIYGGCLAKHLFEKYDNPLGIDLCNDLIDLSITKLRGKIINSLINQRIEVAPFNISDSVMNTKDVADLGTLLTQELKLRRLDLNEYARIYCKLIEGESFDPFKDSIFSDN